MLPPPEASYPNNVALMGALRSDKRKIVIKCDRGSCFRSRAATGSIKKRESATRLVDCQFRITARLQKDSAWILRITIANHNHEPSSDMRDHPTARRLNSSQRTKIRQLLKSGVPPKQILNCLREDDPTVLATPRNIYNERRNQRDEELMGRASLEVLLDDLHQPGPGWSCQIQRDGENRLTHLFFSCSQSVELLRRYPYTLVIDCTYKTNRFKMPLLHIIGTTSFNMSFSVAFAFLRYEREHDYQWALENIIGLFFDKLPVTIATDRELALTNSIETLLPNIAHLLCAWHIQKNVLNNCRKYFGSEDDWAKFLSAWTKVIESLPTQSYEENVEKLRGLYASLPVMLTYISETWLIYKEKFVHAYSNNFIHFGNLTSSRAEGMHHMIKSYILVSTRDLCDVHARIYQAIQAQVANHSALLS
ncbi:hypothetical protein K3495_g3695 [Podosphaera aphanis]|nr:hypothetical protein K3495_g3695 [Podosphaera aphanis]